MKISDINTFTNSNIVIKSKIFGFKKGINEINDVCSRGKELIAILYTLNHINILNVVTLRYNDATTMMGKFTNTTLQSSHT